jgi:SWI/SNF-related matrix-associated actin-dependent regulator 1 of chromatin subfamily A
VIESPTNPKVSKESTLTVEGDRIVLTSPYDQQLVRECRAIPGRDWVSLKKVNTWPLNSSVMVKELAERWQISIPDELLAVDDVEIPVTFGVEVDEDRVKIRFEYDSEMVKDMHQVIPEAVFKRSEKYWWTTLGNLPQAVHYAQKHDLAIQPGILEYVAAEREVAKERFKSSYATDADIDVKTETELLPYQRAGVKHLLENRRTILADDPGLGKTCQALAAVSSIGRFPCVVVSPNTLKLNWEVEVEKFTPWLTVNVISGSKPAEIEPADIVVINYDIIAKRADDIIDLNPQAFVCDEGHAFKNTRSQYVCPMCGSKLKVNSRNCGECKARDITVVEKWTVKRGEGVMRIAAAMPQEAPIYVLTGTPVTNRPIELVPLLTATGGIEAFGGRWRFINRYCDGGTGATNLMELNRKLRETGAMIRRTKAEIFKELPPLRNAIQYMEVAESDMAEYRRIEADVVEFLAQRAREIAVEIGEDPDDAYWEKRMRAEAAEHLVRISVLKGAVVDLKHKSVVSWLDNFLEESDEKIIVFAERVEIVEKLAEHFGDSAVKIRGGVKIEDRMAAVKRFQEDPTCRVFVGNMAAASEGITLTAASNVAFVEQAWSPSTHTQCAARSYGRVQNLHGAVAWYLLVKGTIDADINRLLESKAKIIDAVMNGVSVEKQGSILGDLTIQLARRGLEQAA